MDSNLHNCINCNKKFKSNRKDKKYCSVKCNGQFLYKNNKEKYKKTAKEWALKNKEKRKHIQKKYNKKSYAENIKKNPNWNSENYFKYKDTYQKSSKKYKKNNKKIIYALNNKRRALKIKAMPKWSNLEKIKEFYKNCPKGHTVDHIYPLKSEWVCGLHVIENLQYLSSFENISKNNKKLKKYHKEAYFGL
jgi:hypothetical protein